MSRFIEARFKKIELDDVRYTRDLDAAIQGVIKEAWVQFLRAAEAKIPVETGEARGLLQPIADFVGEQLDLAGANPTERKNAAEGAHHATLDASEFQWPKYVVIFKAETFDGWWWERFQSLWNERIQRRVTAGPWEAFEAGKAAYIYFIQTNLKAAIPDIKHYLTASPIRPREVVRD